MIEDKELRSLFRIESGEHLQHLDDGLLQLEKSPADQALLEALFREAHSLKGVARMLGLSAIQTLAHRLEEALGAARSGGAAQPGAVAAMSQLLIEIRGQVQEAVEGGKGESGGRDAEPQAAPVAPPLRVSPPDAFRIETIRVDPRRLDGLLTQAGELTVTKIRIARRLAELDDLIDSYDEWGKGRGGDQAQLLARLNRLRGGAYEDSVRLDFIAERLEGGIRAMRLLPLSTLFALFPRLVHDLAQEQHKEAELAVEGEETVADKRILEEMKDPLMHILRNAMDHGIETPEQRQQAGKPRSGVIRIRASQTPASVIIEISDDGRGLDLEGIKRTALKRGMYREQELAAMSEAQLQSLVLVSGFSTSGFITDVSGRGVGLDVVRNNVQRLKGTLQLESLPGKGLTLRMQLPVSLATARVLTVIVGGSRYALPVEQVQFSKKIAPQELFTMEGRSAISLDGQAISVAWLDELLANAPAAPRAVQSTFVCIVLAVGEALFGLLADELEDELEVVLKPQSKLLKRVRNISGATILETGEVCMVLNPHDLLKSLCARSVARLPQAPAREVPAKKAVLLAEDSITTRTQERRILEGAGYEVVTAVDGLDAYNKLGSRPFDAVVSDILMPNMDGLTLAGKIRANKKYAELPIILVSSLSSDEDQRRGLEAGANAYISKPSFDQQGLLDCLERLI